MYLGRDITTPRILLTSMGVAFNSIVKVQYGMYLTDEFSPGDMDGPII